MYKDGLLCDKEENNRIETAGGRVFEYEGQSETELRIPGQSATIIEVFTTRWLTVYTEVSNLLEVPRQNVLLMQKVKRATNPMSTLNTDKATKWRHFR